jgi:hypothetical protein
MVAGPTLPHLLGFVVGLQQWALRSRTDRSVRRYLPHGATSGHRSTRPSFVILAASSAIEELINFLAVAASELARDRPPRAILMARPSQRRYAVQVTEAGGEFVRWLETTRGPSSHTVRAYGSDIRTFGAFVGAHAQVGDISGDVIIGFVGSANGRELSVPRPGASTPGVGPQAPIALFN